MAGFEVTPEMVSISERIKQAAEDLARAAQQRISEVVPPLEVRVGLLEVMQEQTVGVIGLMAEGLQELHRGSHAGAEG